MTMASIFARRDLLGANSATVDAAEEAFAALPDHIGRHSQQAEEDPVDQGAGRA